MTQARQNKYEVPETMRAWVLGGPGELRLETKPVPRPGPAEVLVRVDAIAVCATDVEVIDLGEVALIQGGKPFNKGFTPGHEYMGTIVALGPDVDEFEPGTRVSVEVHAGCGRCERCRMGMYTSCLNYGMNYGDHDKGHRANGFTTDGGFAEYAVNNINTLVPIPDHISDEIGTLVTTGGTAMYGLNAIGGLVAGQSVVVIGGGPIGLMAVGVAKALGASPVILTDIRDARLEKGTLMGADFVVNASQEDPVAAVHRLNGGRGVHYVMECSGARNAVNEAARMVSRGGRVCLAAFAPEPVPIDTHQIVSNNIYLYGIRGEGQSAVRRAASLIAEGKVDPSVMHTHTFSMEEVPTAINYARERIDDAIKVVVKIH